MRIVLAAKLLGKLNRLIDGDRNGHIVHVAHFVHGKAQHATIDHRHAVDGPVLGASADCGVDVRGVRSHPHHKGTRVIIHPSLLRKEVFLQNLVGGNTQNLALVQRLQRAAARERTLMSFSHERQSLMIEMFGSI